MCRLLAELGFEQEQPAVIYSDNEAARMLSENPVQHDRTKHIDNQYHYIRDVVSKHIAKVVHVASVDEEADILTKEYRIARWAERQCEDDFVKNMNARVFSLCFG